MFGSNSLHGWKILSVFIFFNLYHHFKEQRTEQNVNRVEICLSNDLIMRKDEWNAPIIIPEHNIILWVIPKVGSTILKRFVARIYNYNNWRHGWFHGPSTNHFKRLYQYNASKVTDMMTSRKWVKIIFLRDPYKRLKSAYKDKNKQKGPKFTKTNKTYIETVCGYRPENFTVFVKMINNGCKDPHWDPQMHLIDKKWLKHITFWGRLDHFCKDFKRITLKLHLWNMYGASGWNEKNGSICESTTPHQNKKNKIEVIDLPESIYNRYELDKKMLAPDI